MEGKRATTLSTVTCIEAEEGWGRMGGEGGTVTYTEERGAGEDVRRGKMGAGGVLQGFIAGTRSSCVITVHHPSSPPPRLQSPPPLPCDPPPLPLPPSHLVG